MDKTVNFMLCICYVYFTIKKTQIVMICLPKKKIQGSQPKNQEIQDKYKVRIRKMEITLLYQQNQF